MSHLRSVGISLPAELLDYIDNVRGTLNRSTAIRAILSEWRNREVALPKIENVRRKNRWYGIDTRRREHAIRAFQSRVDLSAWVGKDPKHRQQITMKTKPEWVTVEFLHTLPTHQLKAG